MARLLASLLAVAIVTAAMAFTTASGASYTVGEPGGSWDLQTNLTAWASSVEFHSGDQLVFKDSAASHDVVEVTRSSYNSCSAASPISKFQTGNDTVQLGGVGIRYFICSVPGHCVAGMKLEVRTSQRKSSCNSPRRRRRTGTARRGGACLGDDNAAPGSSGSVSSWIAIMLLLLGLTF
ncbi:hypothetical protein EJB05_09901, partial [Eragrostis curvula]